MTSITRLSQFKRGKDVEAFLDGYFRARGYRVRQTTAREERVLCLGDREITKNGQTFFMEYKSGIQTHYTRNIFLETISVDDPAHFRQGWIYTCRADAIVYATLLDGCLLIFDPTWLRERMPILKAMFPEIATSHRQNKGYNTHGLLVPFGWAKDNLASKVIQLPSKESSYV